ncbi:putative thiamine transporter SLC35F3 isoform X1 [Scyliorhinus canicula]|uniref:putative thiamine transporter SLC35F3 isoform X1 n=1 Tax=Scyliorhinus canicula TaxID=7830 RepID=UPI0018F6C577|nr:putative thiamine transporter SLC35F3 isoform X1 [Scyliorhinus canicula]
MGVTEFPESRAQATLTIMRRSPDVSPRRLSDVSPQLRQLKYLVVDECIKEDLKASRSFEDLSNISSGGLTPIEERILRITGYYGYQPWPLRYARDERPAEASGGGSGAGSSRTEAEARGEAGEGGGAARPLGWRASCCPCRFSVGQLKKALWGSAVVLSVCSSWAGTSQLAKITFRTFDAPFAITWFATSWNVLFFLLYYVGHAWSSEEKQSPLQRLRECCRFFGDDGLTIKIFFSRMAPFCVLWTLTNYLYLLALKKISATDASALFCCNKAFVFLLSWIVLRDKFMGVRIVAAIFAMAGIVMITYSDGFHSHSVIGITLVVASASLSALYKVLFKMLLGSAKYGEAALFLSVLGLFNVTFITCVPLALYFTGVEHWTPFSHIPWEKLCGMAILLLSFNILMNFGIAVTSPTLISVGVVLSVPVNAVAEAYSSDIVFNSVRVVAILIICLGFLLLLLPEEWDRLAVEFISRFKVSKKEEVIEERGEPGFTGQSRNKGSRTSTATFAHSF